MKRLSSIRRIPGVALLLVAAALSAQDLVPYADQSVVSKEAWLWNDDERIAARFDPVKIRERAAAHAARSFRCPGVSSGLGSRSWRSGELQDRRSRESGPVSSVRTFWPVASTRRLERASNPILAVRNLIASSTRSLHLRLVPARVFLMKPKASDTCLGVVSEGDCFMHFVDAAVCATRYARFTDAGPRALEGARMTYS